MSTPTLPAGWELVVGLEVHVQLDTRTKIFCGCRNRFGDAPNTNICPVCLGYPGALPVLNGHAVEQAAKVALALGCDVPETSIFARKNYFYPDLPKGYQISQFDRPLALGGAVPIEREDGRATIELTRIHMEEDAGKSLHDESGRGSADTRIDLNRCGTPLIEIVSEPVIRDPEDAGRYLESLRRIVRYLGVSDGDMSQGSLRCDANVSVRRTGETELGTKTEVKNLNSIKMVVQAIHVEAARQVAVLERGERIIQATLLWDEKTENVRLMRTKEDAHDYRYFPEPDLAPVELPASRRVALADSLAELPFAKRDRFVDEFDLPAYDAKVLTDTREMADWFEAVAGPLGDGKLASNWVMGEVARVVKESGEPIGALPVTPAGLVELLKLVQADTISQSVAKGVFAQMLAGEGSAGEIVERDGLAQISDLGALDEIVRSVLGGAEEQVAQFRDGNDKVLGFLVGQVMKASKGQANPKLARERLLHALKGDA